MAQSQPSMLDVLQPEAVNESCNRVMAQIHTLHRAWLDSVQEVTDSGWSLATRLARCSDPVEAGYACNEWLRVQNELLLARGQRLSGLWLKLYEPPAFTPEAATAPGEARPATQGKPSARAVAAAE